MANIREFMVKEEIGMEATWSTDIEQTLENKHLRINNRLAQSGVSAGGPGSGRHAEYGSFTKTDSKPGSTIYKSAKGTQVRVAKRAPGSATRVLESIPGETTSESQVYKGYPEGNASQFNDLHDFMKTRYGIKVGS